MVKAGYVEKRPCEGDGRGLVLVLTDTGKALRKRMWPVYHAAIQRQIGSHLNEKQARTLCTLLIGLLPETDGAPKGCAPEAT